jgi:hypothetical protein
MEKRLATVDARSLINALARAERLGYESQDVVEEGRPAPNTNLQPRFSAPSTQPQSQPQPQPQQWAPPQSSQQSQPIPSPAARVQNEQAAGPQYVPSAQQWQGRRPQAVQAPKCPLCWRTFSSTSSYEYVSPHISQISRVAPISPMLIPYQHVKKQICTKTASGGKGFKSICSYCGSGFTTALGRKYVSRRTPVVLCLVALTWV